MLKTSVISGVILSMNLFAYPVCQHSWGQVSCSSGTIDKLDAQGIVSMVDTIVKGKSRVDGTLNAENVTLNELNTHGLTMISNSKVNGNSNIYGALKADNTEFKGRLFIASENAEFNSCIANEIVVSSNKFNSIIKLTGNTTIKNIAFSKAGGEVWLYDNSKVLNPAQGGTIIKK